MRILAYSDASHTSQEDRSFQAGIIVFIQAKNEKVAPISWLSKTLAN